jgi:hypothetical protein
MYVIYRVITILAALANGYVASLNFVGAESVEVVADRVQVSRRECSRSARCWPRAPSDS